MSILCRSSLSKQNQTFVLCDFKDKLIGMWWANKYIVEGQFGPT